MITSLIKGLVTNIPGWQRMRRKEGGGAGSARYCYSVWLRHRVLAAQQGFVSHFDTLAELGPGDSLGIGLAALLSGCRKYIALDAVPFTGLRDNMKVFDELADLFRRRAPIPDNSEFPNLEPTLPDYHFPKDLFSDDWLNGTLNDGRLAVIRATLSGRRTLANGIADVVYVAPWNTADIRPIGSVDVILSQAVMEHVDDLRSAYRAMYEWLKPGGLMSHEIDFKSHGSAKKWNGHWAYSDTIWKIIKGDRRYFLNRQALRSHLMQIQQEGFEIIHIVRRRKEEGIRREKLCRKMREISDDDLVTSSAYILARKREEHGE
jgi:hypothetical protein